jgi:hypothetical protein
VSAVSVEVVVSGPGVPPARFARDGAGWSSVDSTQPGGQPVSPEESPVVDPPRWVRCSADRRLHLVAALDAELVEAVAWCGHLVVIASETFSQESAGLCGDCLLALGQWGGR